MNIAAGKTILRRFIVLEGIDGAGTTTQLNRIREVFSKKGVPHWITCEPTARPEGALIRQILGGGLSADPGTVAHLFAADRHEHLYGAEGIIRHLDAGEIVVCDRYVLSSLAYQGVACGPDLPARLNSGFPLPELTFYFDVDPALSMQRLANRKKLEIYEKLSFQEKVARQYENALENFSLSGANIVRIDASSPPAAVTACVMAALGRALSLDLNLDV